MSDNLRLFVAIGLPDDLRTALARLQHPVESPGRIRWVRPETLHVTVKFLGSTPRERLPEVRAAVLDVAHRHAPLHLAARKTGAFPSWSRPKVIWAGLEGDVGALRNLVDDTEEAMEELGFPRSRRAYHPHITLGRVKRGPVEATRAALEPVGELGEADVDEILLFESETEPEGARYLLLAAAPLRGHD